MRNNQMPQEFKDKLSKLSKRERMYFMAMWPKSGVLYITSKPGLAKSAIARSIADKMGFQYLDIRLSMVDETDVGLYPKLGDHNGNSCLEHVVPKWAMLANDKPTIIHFEELNRAQQSVRNAALQILLERSIGVEFKFNSNVLMMASGNLGEEDGTDVEEFDSALKNRLIHFKHDLVATDWLQEYAKENIHKTVRGFIESYPERLYETSTNTPAYATPRTWTFLSDFIIDSFGPDSTPKQFVDDIQDVATNYIGHTAQKFIQYCHDMARISTQDVIDRFDEIKSELKTFNRDKKSEIVQGLREVEIQKLTAEQIKNICKFLKLLSEDEKTSFLLHIIDKYEVENEVLLEFIKNEREWFSKLDEINNTPKK